MSALVSMGSSHCGAGAVKLRWSSQRFSVDFDRGSSLALARNRNYEPLFKPFCGALGGNPQIISLDRCALHRVYPNALLRGSRHYAGQCRIPLWLISSLREALARTAH